MINSVHIVRATAPPGDSSAEWKQAGMSGSERVSQWPLCQRDECWKLLGKRIRAVYVGQVARCQLLKCANFLKLQRFGLLVNLFTVFTLHPDCMEGCALFRGKAPSASATTSKKARSAQRNVLDSKPAFQWHQNTPLQCANCTYTSGRVTHFQLKYTNKSPPQVIQMSIVCNCNGP